MNDLERSLAWARRHMPVTQAQLDALPTLGGVRLACSIHLTYNSLVALESLLARGAALFITTCNPRTVQDECVQRLLAAGAEGHAWLGMTDADQADAVERALRWQPTHLYEMGADLSAALVVRGGAASVPSLCIARPRSSPRRA